jgi:insertion element IS1 protein InsB
MIVRDACPACGSTRFKRNGHTRNGKQKHQCKACARQFVECAEHYRIADETRALIERLLLERISLRGICRAVGVGLKWLLGFIVHRFETLPEHLHIQPITCTQDVMIQRLEVEADEMSSFVQKKANKQWTLILDSRVLCDQQLNERTKQRFAALSDVVHKLEEPEVKRELLL